MGKEGHVYPFVECLLHRICLGRFFATNSKVSLNNLVEFFSFCFRGSEALRGFEVALSLRGRYTSGNGVR